MSTLTEEPVPTAPPIRKWPRRLGWIALWLFTLVTLAIAFENWTGSRAWKAAISEVTAKGERLEPAAVIPPPIPDAQNFAAAPLFDGLFDYTYEKSPNGDSQPPEPVWRDPAAKKLKDFDPVGGANTPELATWRYGRPTDLIGWQRVFQQQGDFPKAAEPQSPGADILLGLSKYDVQLQELRNAAARPESRYPLHYDESLLMVLPHISMLRGMAKLTVLRALAELEAGHPEQALADELLTLRIAESLANEPLMISMLVRNAVLELAMQPLWEGLVTHRWTDQQLAELSDHLGRINLIAQFQLSVRGERNLMALPAMEQMRSGQILPGITPLTAGSWKVLSQLFSAAGWIDHNKAVMARSFQDILACSDAESMRLYPDRVRAYEAKMNGLQGTPANTHTVFARMMIPPFNSLEVRCADGQDSVHLARIAIALERHRLKHGSYPEALEALDAELVPSGAQHLPLDVVTGTPPHYRLQSAEHYLLYYAGWNGTDDGGEQAWKEGKPKRRDAMEGDWVWPQREL